MRAEPFSRFKAHSKGALARGATARPGSLIERLQGNCLDPVTLTTRYWNRRHTGFLYIERTLRCRRCTKCLSLRAFIWRSRAETEIRNSPRTWFVTLTFDPHHRSIMLYRARLLASRRAVQWSDLSAQHQRTRLAAEVGKETTLWLKRVRKSAQTRFRYLLVQEPHKDGFPHVHALVHEIDLEAPVPYRSICNAWHRGFAHAKLVDRSTSEASAGYVAKYLSKTMAGRVRSSQSYGAQPIEVWTQAKREPNDPQNGERGAPGDNSSETYVTDQEHQ